MVIHWGLLFLLFLGVRCQHPLYDYVALDDGTGTDYTELASYPGTGYTVYILTMTSQNWQTGWSSVDTWTHYMAVVLPDTPILTDLCGMVLKGGTNNDDAPDDTTMPLLAVMAMQTGACQAAVFQTMNQPIVFSDDAGATEQYDNELVSWTWTNFMDQSAPRDPTVIIQYPMTKAAKKAMDAVVDFAPTKNAAYAIDKFSVLGEARYGWTAYLIAAADSRVIGFCPSAFSTLNLQANLHHHYRSLGGWSFPFEPYWIDGLSARLDSAEFTELTLMQDPHTPVLRNDLTEAALLLRAGNDEFDPIDNGGLFFNDLPGNNKFTLIVENMNHSMSGQDSRLLQTLLGFTNLAYTNSLPTYSWTQTSDASTASTTISLDRAPNGVTVHYANTDNTDNRRDWRWYFLEDLGPPPVIPESGISYSQDIQAEDLGGNEYRVSFNAPASGWTIFFITVEVTVGTSTLEFSTEANTVPNTFGYADCSGAACLGILK